MITVYLAKNKKNGKVYVGKTVQKLYLRVRCHKSTAQAGSGLYFHRAIRKYGFESFEIRPIGFALTWVGGIILEQSLIRYYDSDNPRKGYNLTIGGEGQQGNAETRRKISETHKARGIRPPGNGHLPRTEEWLRRMSENRKGIPAWNKGKKLSSEHIAKLKAAVRPKVNRRDTRPDVLTSDLVETYDGGNGPSCVKIAAVYGVSKETVARRLKKAGVALRPVGFQKGNAAHKALAECGAT